MTFAVERPAEPVDPAESWAHEALLEGAGARHAARAFVSARLVDHEVSHLVAAASVVAAILTRDVMLRSGSALRLTVSRTDAVVRVTVDCASDEVRTGTQPSLLDLTPGHGILGLLSLRWGVTVRPERVDGLWAVFDARDPH